MESPLISFLNIYHIISAEHPISRLGINNPNSPLAELVAHWSPLEKRTSGRLSRSAFPPCSTRWRRIWPLVLNGKPHMISSALCFRKPKRSSKLPMVSVLSILRSILYSWPFEVQLGCGVWWRSGGGGKALLSLLQ